MPVFTLPKSSHPDFALPNVKPKGPKKLDISHPLAPDEVCADLGAEFEYVTGQRLSNKTAGIDNVIVKGNEGRHFDGANEESFDLPISISHAAGTKWSVTWYGQKNADDNDGMVMGLRGTAEDYIWAYSNDTINVNAGLGDAVVTISGGEDFLTPKWRTIVFDGVSGYEFFQDGVSEGTSTSVTDVEELVISQIGHAYINASFACGWDITDVFIHSWGLSAEQVAVLHRDAYQFYDPAIPLTYFMPAEEAAQYFTFELPKSHHPDFALPNVKPKGPVEIDWDKTINSKLLSCVLDSDIDLRTGTIGTTYEDATRIRNDISFNAGGDGSRVEYGLGSLTDKDVFTFESIITIRASKSLIIYWGLGEYTGDNNPSGGKQRAILDFNGRIYFWDATTAWDTAYDVSNLTDGRPHQLTFVSDGTNLYFYVDGIEKANTTTPASLGNMDGTQTFKAGGAHISATTSGDFDFHLGLFWDRALSLGETQERADQWYSSILAPAIPLTYFVPGAAAAGGNEPLFYHHQRMLSRCS